jgi:hypothetical protein
VSNLILVRTATRRYAVRRDDVMDIRLAVAGEGHQAGRPPVEAELGPLLDPCDQGALRRPQALIVPLRRREIALLVARVEEFLERPAAQPFPPFVRERLRQPWATGALLVDDEVVVQLDLRAVARSVLLLQQSGAEERSPSA